MDSWKSEVTQATAENGVCGEFKKLYNDLIVTRVHLGTF